MIRLFLILLGMASAVFPQARLAIDLSGDWKWSDNPDPSFSRPDLDDSRWVIERMPWSVDRIRAIDPTAWLRKTIELPPDADRRDVVLTLGALRGRYVVYVNGHHLASVGRLDTHTTTQLARPRSFPVPERFLAVNGRRVTIAIRLAPPPSPNALWSQADRGPYLLTHSSVAPKNAGVDSLAQRRQLYTPLLVMAVMYFMLTVPVLLAWFGERQRRDLLALSLLLFTYGFYGAYSVFTIAPDTQPYAADGDRLFQSTLEAARHVLFVWFVVEALGFRSLWLRGLIGMSWLASFGRVAPRLFTGWFLTPRTVLVLALALVAGPAIVVAWRKLCRTGAPLRRHLFIGTLALRVLIMGVSGVVRLLSPSAQYLEWNGYRIPHEDLATLVPTLAVVGMLFWEWSADRAERQRLASEFEAARVVQRLLLPEPSAQGPVITDAVYAPAREVGGDFYQIAHRDDGSTLVLVGDVSGKGMEAAMMASVAVGAFRQSTSGSPAELLEGLNRALCGHGRTGFVTCCCARFDADGYAVMANAGHPAPLCDGVEVEAAAELPLGLVPESRYSEVPIPFGAGAQVTFFSDGVVEAENAARELFGFERTRALSAQSAQAIAEAAKQWGQNDDITVVTVRRVSA